LKKWENTLILNLCVVDRGGWGLLPKEVQVWAPGSVDKLCADFTIKDMKLPLAWKEIKQQGVREYWLRVGNVLVAKDKKVKL
jgi:hypothetical protein